MAAGFNDLATTHPDLAVQWDAAKNAPSGLDPTTVSAGSERKVWWRCPAGHSSEAVIKSRARENLACPDCTAWSTSRREIQVRCELQAVGVPVVVRDRWNVGGRMLQLDIVVPDWALVIEYDGHRWTSVAASQTPGSRSDR